MPVNGVEGSGRTRVDQKLNQNRSEDVKAADDEKKLAKRVDGQTQSTRSVSESGQGETIDISA